MSEATFSRARAGDEDAFGELVEPYRRELQRTPAGWRFAERFYELKYLDTTPLAGWAPAGGRLQVA